MQLKQKRHLSKEEFDKITEDIRDMIGDRLKNHKDGDSERFLLSKEL